MIRLSFLAACASLSISSVVLGAFENPSFEEPYLDNFWSFSMPGWTNLGGAGVFVLPLSGAYDSNAPDGRQAGFTNGWGVAQQSSYAIGVGVNTLEIFAGRRADAEQGGLILELWAGGTVANGDVSGGTLLGSTEFLYPSVSPGSWQNISVEYVADSSDSYLGELVTARILPTNGQPNFDHVRFSVVVPEPMSVALLALLAPFALRRRRKR